MVGSLDMPGGNQVFDVSNPERPRAVGFIGTGIFALGVAVSGLCDGVLSAGAQDFPWDGRDDGGRPVAAGIYWVRVTTNDGSMSRRLVVLR